MDIKIIYVAILAKVQAHETPPFRPIIQDPYPPGVFELMEKCWADNPDDRPSFLIIRSTVQCIMK